MSSSDPEQEKHRLFAALTQFFTGQAMKQPVLLIIEDIHWSDDTSLEFLYYLARRCSAHPLLLLLTYRSDEVRPEPATFPGAVGSGTPGPGNLTQLVSHAAGSRRCCVPSSPSPTPSA